MDLDKIGPALHSEQATAIAAFLALALAVLSLLTQFQTWRASLKSRFRYLDLRIKAVQFWDAWLAAQGKILTGESLKQAQRRAQSELAKLVHEEDEEIQAHALTWTRLRAILFLEWPKRRLHRICRGIYFVFLILAVGVLVWAAIDLSSSKGVNGQEISLTLSFELDMIPVVSFAALAWLMRLLAGWIEKRWPDGPERPKAERIML